MKDWKSGGRLQERREGGEAVKERRNEEGGQKSRAGVVGTVLHGMAWHGMLQAFVFRAFINWLG